MYFAIVDRIISWPDGRDVRFEIAVDITETRRIQAVIDAKNKELEQLVYVASHDLRSPLVNVDGFSRELNFTLRKLTVLLDSGKDKEELAQALRMEFRDMEKSVDRIRASTGQMDRLLRGLLHLSRQGRAALHFDDIDMNQCIAQLLSSFAYVMKENGVELTVDNLPACRGDAVQLTQVFANLIDNAIKYRDPARPLKIQITGALEANRAVYRVKDNGVGIAAGHIAHVFELFHRLDPGNTPGEGLGLTIVRQALSRMYGEIRVESEIRRGSVFIVVVPPARRRIDS
jgi:signal transduction histidine kinase